MRDAAAPSLAIVERRLPRPDQRLVRACRHRVQVPGMPVHLGRDGGRNRHRERDRDRDRDRESRRGSNRQEGRTAG